MWTWIVNNIGTIIVVLILAAVVAAIIIVLVRKRLRGESSCGCGCNSCPMKGTCHNHTPKHNFSGTYGKT